MINQQTIQHKVSITGSTLHSGDNTHIVLSPASVDSGITFYLNDEQFHIIELSSREIIKTTLSTNVGIESVYVGTIEHLMSALHALGIDNIDITVNGSEVPILDGSAIQFYNLIKSAGIKQQQKTRSYIVISDTISLSDKGSYIIVEPYDGFIVDMTIKFDHPIIGTQKLIYNSDIDDYGDIIAPARTFGVMNNIQIALKNGLLKGGSIDNAIILDHEKVINPPLRFTDEFIRHKILDFIGDIYVEGSIKGKFTVYCGGHELNNKIMRKIMRKIKEIL